MRLHREVGVLVAGRAVDAQPDARARAYEVLHPARTRAQAHVARGAVRDAGPGLRHALDLRVAEMDPMGVPDVVTGPAEVLHQLIGPHAELLEAELLLVDGIG